VLAIIDLSAVSHGSVQHRHLIVIHKLKTDQNEPNSIARFSMPAASDNIPTSPAALISDIG
jgi:hypothetical protein